MTYIYRNSPAFKNFVKKATTNKQNTPQTTKEKQKQNPKFERYIPEQFLNFLEKISQENPSATSEDFNKAIRATFPDVPTSSRTRWVRAFVDNQAHSETPEWHTRYRMESGLVPIQFSAIRSGQFAEERKKWQKDGIIKYVNWSCWHRPYGDGALISLAQQVVNDFNPNVVPVMSDFIDTDRFSRHAKKVSTFKYEVTDEGEYRKQGNKYDEFLNLSLSSIQAAKDAVPNKDCTFLNLWGNHENWYLSYLIGLSQTSGDSDLIDIFIDKYFTKLQDVGALWMEQDSRRYVPLNQHWWVGHGHRSRNTEGGTAKAFMNSVGKAVSISVGHTHRQEVLWSQTPASRQFYAIAGTLGQLRRHYAMNDFSGHNWGFQLITSPFEGWKNATVEDVQIFYQNGYYTTNVRGKSYSEKATIDYDPLWDMVEMGRE